MSITFVSSITKQPVLPFEVSMGQPVYVLPFLVLLSLSSLSFLPLTPTRVVWYSQLLFPPC